MSYAQPPYPPGGYAGPAYAPPGQPYSPRPQGPAPAGTRPSPPAQVRGQRPDDPPASERRPEPKTALALPPPEQLGIGAATTAPAEIDWNAIHRRLRDLGSTSYQSQRTADGYRFTCLLPTADPNRTQRIEAQATGEAEAIRLALDRADQWARPK